MGRLEVSAARRETDVLRSDKPRFKGSKIAIDLSANSLGAANWGHYTLEWDPTERHESADFFFVQDLFCVRTIRAAFCYHYRGRVTRKTYSNSKVLSVRCQICMNLPL